jgi:hypothetical protein
MVMYIITLSIGCILGVLIACIMIAGKDDKA